MDLAAWASKIKQDLESKNVTPGGLLNADLPPLPDLGFEGPPAKIAKLSHDLAPAPDRNCAFSVTSHNCRICSSEGKQSMYCISCGACGKRCSDCGKQEKFGSIDPDSQLWRCKACWLERKPDWAGNADDKDDEESVAAPTANDSSKKAQWAQVFSTMQKNGQTDKAFEHAQALKKLRETMKDMFSKYKELLSSEEELLQSAYAEALQEYQKQQENQEQMLATQAITAEAMEQQMQLDAAYQQAIELQVQAHQEVQSRAFELNRNVNEAHQMASRTYGDYQESVASGGAALPPKRKLPQRPGMQPCAFFMKTGDCRYGSGCKWDHPDRGDGTGCFLCGGKHYAKECPGMTTGVWQRQAPPK